MHSQNPTPATLVFPSSQQPTPPNLTVDSYTRATKSINLMPGFVYGAISAGATNLLNLNIGSNPTYVSSTYLGSGINPLNTTNCDNQLVLNYSAPYNTNKVVGSTNSDFIVSASGGAVFNMPIQVSPGTQGLEPSLSIQYNNQSGFGVLGSHVDLLGLNNITRTVKTPLQDGILEVAKLTYGDVYSLNGNRLFLLAGTYGQNGATYYTENETFATITSFGTSGFGPSNFIVKDKSGNTFEFGIGNQSYLKGIGDQTILTWYISKQTDEFGNYINYKYKNLNGETVLDRIEYTGNTVSGLQPYNSIEFEYIEAVDKNTFYIGTKQFKSSQILKSITCKSEGAFFKKYVFDYVWKNQSCLSKITEVLVDGSELNPTEFCWEDPTYFNNINGTLNPSNSNIKFSTTYNPAVGASATMPCDYNGDGFSDNFYYYESNDSYEAFVNSPYNVFAATGDTYFIKQFQQSLPVNGLRKHLYNTTIDANLDGKQEVKNFIATGSVTYRVDDVAFNGSNFSITTFSNYALNNTYDMTFKPSQFYYEKLDFTGDGSIDEVRIDPEGIYFNCEIGPATYAIATNSTIARPFDFDGDGSAEFLVLEHLNSNTINIKVLDKMNSGAPLQITQIYASSITFNNIWNWNLLRHIGIGDFNGDGKSDLCYVDAALSGIWILYNDGSQFLPAVKVSNFTPISNNNLYLIDVVCSDINSDGKSDILILDNNNPFNSCFTYLSVGDKVLKGGDIYGKFGQYRISANGKTQYSPARVGGSGSLFIFADYNGDGIADAYSLEDPQQDKIFFGQVIGKSNLLATTIYKPGTDKISINYGNIGSVNCPVPAYMKGSNSSALSGYENFYKEEALSNFSSPLIKYKMNIFCVNRYIYKQGGLKYYKKYFYSNSIVHTQGRGFLGFEKIQEVDPITNTGEQTLNNFNSTFFIPYVSEKLKSKFAINYGSGINSISGLISKSNMLITLVPRNTKGFFVRTDQIDTKDYLSSIREKTDIIYDLTKDGNIININKVYGWGSNTVKTSNTTLTYILNNGQFKPQKISSTSTQTGDSPYTREVAFNYDGQGHLVSKINDPSFGINALTTNYSQFTNFGNPTKICVSAGDVPNRCTETLFDSKGRFVIKHINELNNFEENTYDGSSGLLVQSKDISGLITKYEYDGLGRLIKTTLPSLSTNQTSYDWNSNSSVPDAIYCVNTNNQGEPKTKTYYGFGTKIVRQESEGFNNTVINKHYVYSVGSTTAPVGALLEASDTYFNNQTQYLVTTYSYDPVYFRKIESKLQKYNGAYSATGIFTNFSYNLPSTDVNYVKGFVTTTDNNGRSVVTENNSAGQTDVVKNIDPGVTQISTYQFNSNGKPKNLILTNSVNTAQNITTTFGYNILGQQTNCNDPSFGAMQYSYNTIGELLQETSSIGTFNYTYDNSGRILTKSGNSSGTTYYQYVTSQNGKEAIDKVIGPASMTEYQYDPLQRLTEIKQTIGSKVLKTNYAYDQLSHITEYTYPSGYKIFNNYDNIGNLIEIKNAANQTIWALNSLDAQNQITQFTQGNGLVNTITRDDLHFVTNKTNALRTQKYAPNPASLSLIERRIDNNIASSALMEQFTYDGLDRLTKTQEFIVNGLNINPSNNINNLNYDQLGNILNKDDAGSGYAYTNASSPYKLTNINNPTGNINLNTLNLVYSDFNKVKQISEAVSNKQFDFTYNTDFERIKMEYKINGVNQYTRYYAENYDRQEATSGYKEWNYIYSPSGLTAIYFNNNGNAQLLYTTTDHVGSPILLTDANQVIKEEYSFDAWGRKRSPTNWSNYGVSQSAFMIRGYTMHEYLDEIALLNMNGRVYDPLVGRFLQPDNFITYPTYLQNYNRYAYGLNNPLKFVDPDGNNPLVVAAIVGAVVGGYSGYQIGKAHGATGWQMAAYIAGGAAIGAISGLTGGLLAGSSIAFASTAGILVSSYASAIGNKILTNGESDFVISFGVASYNADKREWGWLGKEGNSKIENIGYGFGALANVQDLVAGFNGTGIDVKARKELFGHSEVVADNGAFVSVGPPDWQWDSQCTDYENEMFFLKTDLQGNPASGVNSLHIVNDDPQFVTRINNVSGKALSRMANNLNKSKNLIGTSPLEYGLFKGCVNYTSRALLFAGVPTVNAFLPITAPVLLNIELGIRQVGIFASPYLVSKKW